MQKKEWIPNENYIQNTRLYKWMSQLGFKNYDQFYQKSIDDTSWFWNEVVKEIGIEWSKPYSETVEFHRGIKYPNWFPNGKLNIIQTAINKWANDKKTKNTKALIAVGDNGEENSFTFFELKQQIDKAAIGLQQLGIKKGDVIAIYLPMIPETVIAMMAISNIGAIYSPIFSGYGAEAVSTRLNAAKAKYIITADGYYRRGKMVSMKAECDRATQLSPSIEGTIVVRRANNPINWVENHDIEWSTILDHPPSQTTVDLSSSDPLMIIYTSGTTGKPKGTVHTHAGFPIKAAFDAGICMDVSPGDRFFWYTDMGWMMGPFLMYGGLINGATIVLFEGTPDYPNPDRLWEIVDRHQVTHLGISPTLIRSLMKYDTSWIEKYSLRSLKVIGSTGEPWNPEPWLWLFNYIGKGNIPIMNYSGGTEISGGILGNVLIKPILPVMFNSPIPGMDIHVYDKDGNPILNEVGELVILKPWVGMTNGFWKDHERYEKTYWNRFPDTWVHGDWVVKDENGFWTITGRSDDTLNIAGKRLGPAEMESILVSHEDVIEAATIGIPDNMKGEAAVCFVVLKSDTNLTDPLKSSLYTLIAEKLGKALLPKEIYSVKELAKTKNGKVMRRIIKAAYLHTNPGDTSSLENPNILKEFQSLQEKNI